jgi:hypothetical protein
MVLPVLEVSSHYENKINERMAANVNVAIEQTPAYLASAEFE